MGRVIPEEVATGMAAAKRPPKVLDCGEEGKAAGTAGELPVETMFRRPVPLFEFQEIHSGDEKDRGKANEDQPLGHYARQA